MNNGAEEIVKALRCCSNGSCSECFFRKDKQNCQETMEFMAADMLEYLLSKNDRLYYTLMGVMHFVDKWIDDKPHYYDIKDPDGNIAVKRAAEAREIALQAIEKAERERDAAIRDVSRACYYCKHFLGLYNGLMVTAIIQCVKT